MLVADSDSVVLTNESNLKVYYKIADEGERDEKLDEANANDVEEEDDIKLDSDNENGYSDETLHYLVHSTTPDRVCFFLTAVRRGKTVAQFSWSRLCRVVLGKCTIQPFNASTAIASI